MRTDQKTGGTHQADGGASSWNRISSSDFHALDRMLIAVFADHAGSIVPKPADAPAVERAAEARRRVSAAFRLPRARTGSASASRDTLSDAMRVRSSLVVSRSSRAAAAAASRSARSRAGAMASAAPVATSARAGDVRADDRAARSYNEPLAGAAAHAARRRDDGRVARRRGQAHLPTPVADARLFRACSGARADRARRGRRRLLVRRVRAAAQRHHRAVAALARRVGQRRRARRRRRPAQAAARRDPRATARPHASASARSKRNPDGTGAIVFALQGSGVTTSPIPRALAAGGSARSMRSSTAATRIPRCSSRATTARPSGSRSSSARGAFKRRRVRQARRPPAGRDQRSRRRGLDGARELSDVVRRRAAAVAHRRADARRRRRRDRRATPRSGCSRSPTAIGWPPGLPALMWDDRSRRGRARRTPRRCAGRRSSRTCRRRPARAADRVRAAKIKTGGRARERRARVRRRRGARRADEQPGPSRELMSATATHIGIGVVLGDEISGRRELFLTQVFIRIPPKIDPAAMRRARAHADRDRAAGPSQSTRGSPRSRRSSRRARRGQAARRAVAGRAEAARQARRSLRARRQRDHRGRRDRLDRRRVAARRLQARRRSASASRRARIPRSARTRSGSSC